MSNEKITRYLLPLPYALKLLQDKTPVPVRLRDTGTRGTALRRAVRQARWRAEQATVLSACWYCLPDKTKKPCTLVDEVPFCIAHSRHALKEARRSLEENVVISTLLGDDFEWLDHNEEYRDAAKAYYNARG